MPTVSGVHHIAITVSDLAASVDFYARLLGAPPAASLEDDRLRRRLFALPGGTNLGLTQHDRGVAVPEPGRPRCPVLTLPAEAVEVEAAGHRRRTVEAP